jgi:hypothetical protein
MTPMVQVLVIVLAVLVLAEILARVFFPRPPLWPRPQMRHRLDPKVGYVNQPDQDCYCGEERAHFNSHGFRGPEIAEDRGEVDLRILCMGNSLTLGGGVGDDETYPSHLRRLLEKRHPGLRIEVLNAGIVGFAIKQYIPYLERLLTFAHPDVVLLGMQWRDLHHHPRLGQLQGKLDAETWEAMKKQIDKKQDEFAQKTTKMKVKDAFKSVRSLYVLGYLARKIRDVIRPPNFVLWQRAFLSGKLDDRIRAREEHSREQLPRAKEMCAAGNAEFALVLFPDHKQLFRNYPRSLWPSLAVDICEQSGIPFVDLARSLRHAYVTHRRRLLVPYDPTHYTAIGNEAIANAVFSFLEDTDLLGRGKPTKTQPVGA